MSRSLLIALASLLYSGLAAAAPLAEDNASSGEQGGPASMGSEALDDLDGLDDLDALDGLDTLDGGGGGSTGERRIRLHQYRYFAAVEVRSYLVDRDLPSNDEQLLLDTELELDFRFAKRMKLFLRPRFLIDGLDTELMRFEPLEGYLAYEGSRTGVKLGQFIENWGVAEVNNPLDVLNRRDFGVKFLDPPRLGELGVRLTQSFDGGKVVDQPTLSAYFMPLFRPALLPTEQSRWRPVAAGVDFRPGLGFEPSGAEQMFGALRFEHTLNTRPFNADVSYLVSHGPERFPYFLPVQGPVGVDFIPVYYGVTVAGLGMRAVPFEFEGSPGQRQDDYVQYTTGFDLLINPVFTERDEILLTLEYAGENGASDLASVFRPFDSDIAVRLFWQPLDFARTAIELRAVVDVKHAELVAEATVGQQLRFIHDDLRMTVTGTYMRAATGGQGLLQFFSNNSAIMVRLQFDL
jgi:hypothetical protein